ncbi:MAG: MFS transporter [Candidatus Methanomethylophilaceae archaeon]|nr:MFS transporter [Candidatus Methanomethylophilaceae archaeon]
MIIEDRRSQLLLFGVIAIGMFLDGLDGTIVTVALPEIARSFSMSAGDASWIVTTYFLVMAGLILVFGRISDNGRIRLVVMCGFIGFTAGSFLCGISWSYGSLILFRAVQGVGAAMLASSCLMLAVKFLPAKIIAFGMSVSVLGSSSGSALGPVIGGMLTDTLSWHWIFFINVPIGIIGLALSAKVVPALEVSSKGRFDLVGALLLFIAIATGLYSIEALPTHGFDGTTAVTIPISLMALVGMIVWDRRVDDPVIRLDMFKRPGLVAVIIAFMVMNASFMGLMYLLPFYFNVELGMTTFESGLMMLVQAVTMVIFCMFMGRATDRIGWRPFVLASCMCIIISGAVFAVMDPSMSLIVPIIGLVFMGLVFAFGGGSFSAASLSQVPADDHGSTSSLMSFMIYFGAALGTTIYSALFNIGSGAPDTSIEFLPKDLFMDGFVFSMVVTVLLGILSIALMVWVSRRSDVSVAGATE